MESLCLVAVEPITARPVHPLFAANSIHPSLVQRVKLVCVHPCGVERSSLFCIDPSVGQQAVGKVLDKLKVVYVAVVSTPRVSNTWYGYNGYIASRLNYTLFYVLFVPIVSQMLTKPKASLFSRLMVLSSLWYTAIVCSCFKSQLQCTIRPFSHKYQCLVLIRPRKVIPQLLMSIGFFYHGIQYRMVPPPPPLPTPTCLLS